MKFVFFVKYIDNHLCITKIRKPNSANWYLFRTSDYSNSKHDKFVTNRIDKIRFSNYQTVTIDLPVDVCLHYYNVIRDVFVFNGFELESGKLN